MNDQVQERDATTPDPAATAPHVAPSRLTVLAGGDAPVCEGDACLLPDPAAPGRS